MTEPMPMPPPDETGEIAQNRTKSKGEKFFDRAVYAGIAGVGTFITTIFLTFFLSEGKGKAFHKYLSKGIKGLAETIAPGRDHTEFASEAVKTTTLMMGGNLMLIPIGIAEKHKVALVDGLNTAMDDKTPKETIQQSPKQTWGSLIKSRGLAWCAVFVAFFGASKKFSKTMNMFEHETGELFAGIASKPTHTGEMVEKLVKGVETMVPKETVPYALGKIAALDVFATIGSATLLYLGGHFFARKQEEKIEKREEQRMAMSEPSQRDEAPSEVTSKIEIPSVQIAGTKQHDGTTREPLLSPQI